MSGHRFFRWAFASTAIAVLLALSFARAAQEATQVGEKASPGSTSASRDPFDIAEKAATESSGKPGEKASAKTSEPMFVRKTDEEWAKILNPAVFRVTRWKETEPAFSGRYATGHYRGTFTCACCGAELFNAQHKFDSGTGWPSFWRPVAEKAIQRAIDNSEAEQRVEVMCRRCGAHLGHVFDDNPAAPTGLRYCINSLSLKLKPPEGTATKVTSTKSKAKGTAKISSSTTAKTKTKNAGQTTNRNQASNKATAPDSPEQGDPNSSRSKGGSSGN